MSAEHSKRAGSEEAEFKPQPSDVSAVKRKTADSTDSESAHRSKKQHLSPLAASTRDEQGTDADKDAGKGSEAGSKPIKAMKGARKKPKKAHRSPAVGTGDTEPPIDWSNTPFGDLTKLRIVREGPAFKAEVARYKAGGPLPDGVSPAQMRNFLAAGKLHEEEKELDFARIAIHQRRDDTVAQGRASLKASDISIASTNEKFAAVISTLETLMAEHPEEAESIKAQIEGLKADHKAGQEMYEESRADLQASIDLSAARPNIARPKGEDSFIRTSEMIRWCSRLGMSPADWGHEEHGAGDEE